MNTNPALLVLYLLLLLLVAQSQHTQDKLVLPGYSSRPPPDLQNHQQLCNCSQFPLEDFQAPPNQHPGSVFNSLCFPAVCHQSTNRTVDASPHDPRLVARELSKFN